MPRKTPENEEDYIRMQQEAIRRVRDMQDRARLTLESAGVPLGNHEDTGHTPPPASSSAPRQNPGPAWEARQARSYTQSVWNAPVQVPREMLTPPSFENRSTISGAGPSAQEEPPDPPADDQAPPPPHRRSDPQPRAHPNIPSFISNLLPSINLNFDSEQVLLLILIFVLYQDKADNFLILALVYILLL